MFSVYLRWQSKRPPSQKVCGLNPREEIIIFLLSTQVKSLDFFYLSLFITGLKGRPAYLFFSFLFLLHFFQLVFNLLQFVILTFQFFLQVVYGSHSGLIFILVAFTLQFQNDSTSYLYIPIFRVLKPKTFAFLRCHATTLPLTWHPWAAVELFVNSFLLRSQRTHTNKEIGDYLKTLHVQKGFWSILIASATYLTSQTHEFIEVRVRKQW